MTRNEIVEQVISLIGMHLADKRGQIDQEPYKGDFFRLFAAAYNAGMMDGSEQVLYADTLADMVGERTSHEFTDAQVFRHVQEMWREWTYACDHCDVESVAPEL